MEYEAKQAVHLPALDYLELHLLETRPGVKPDALVAELVKSWLATETSRHHSQAQQGAEMRGFQWKNVFLPHGTCLRTGYGDAVEFARVVGNRLVADDGHSLTPSAFANRRTKGRNAWRFVWVRFPDDNSWIRADDCRSRCSSFPLKRSKEANRRYNVI